MTTNRKKEQGQCNGGTDMKDTDMIIEKIQDLSEHMDKRFEEMSGQMGSMENRMDNLSGRMDGIENRMDNLSGRMDGIENRMDKMSEQVDQRFNRLENDVTEIRLTLENDVMRYIGVIADGHIDLNKKLDEVLENKKEVTRNRRK